jgi:hypothetical protein
MLTITKTGPRHQVLPNEEGYKTVSLSATTVSVLLVRSVSMYPSHNSIGKKLKKRLEDLERRVGSSSASTSQQSAHLLTSDSVATIHKSSTSGLEPSSTSIPVNQYRGSRRSAQQDMIPFLEDSSTFSERHIRQPSTPPPSPFSHPSLDRNSMDGCHTSCSQSIGYFDILPSTDIATQRIYKQWTPEAYTHGIVTPPIKRELLAEDGVDLFSMDYNFVASFDISTTGASSHQNLVPTYVSNIIAHSSVQ